jgi:DNA-binding TFAR19-related protein (PDSD5 family)
MSSELDEVRRRRLEEFQRAFEGQQSQQQEAEEQITALESLVKARLTKDALSRYTNLKIAYPDKAMQLLAVLAQAIQQYNIKMINDAQLKDLMMRITPKQKEFKITRK